jgi:RHS repeat-associated protein
MQLKNLAPRYGCMRYLTDDEPADTVVAYCPFTEVLQPVRVVNKVIQVYLAVFGIDRPKHRDAGDLILKLARGDYRPGTLIQADDINIMRDLLEQISDVIFVRGGGADTNGWKVSDDGSTCPITFNLDFGPDLNTGDWISKLHLDILEGVVDGFVANKLWLSKGSPSISVQALSSKDCWSDEYGCGASDNCYDYEFESPQNVSGTIASASTNSEEYRTDSDPWEESWTEATVSAYSVSWHVTMPDNHNPHGGNPVSVIEKGKIKDEGPDVEALGLTWGSDVTKNIGTETISGYVISACGSLPSYDYPAPNTSISSGIVYSWFSPYGFRCTGSSGASVWEMNYEEIIYQSRSRSKGAGGGFTSGQLYGMVGFTYLSFDPQNGPPYQLTEWTDLAPTSIKLVSFEPPKDSPRDALFVPCNTCQDSACQFECMEHNPGRYPGLSIFLAMGSSWFRPGAASYMSLGNTNLPVSGMSLCTSQEGCMLSYSLDTHVIGISNVTDPATGTEQQFINLLRPTGRIVTFNLSQGGEAVGVDKDNDYWAEETGTSHVNIVYPGEGGEDTVIHHYYGNREFVPNSLLGLSGVASVPPELPLAEAKFESLGVGDDSRPIYGFCRMIYNSCYLPLTEVTSPLYDIELSGIPFTSAIFKSKTTGEELIRMALTYIDGVNLASIQKEVKINGVWTLVDSLTFTPVASETGPDDWKTARFGKQFYTKNTLDPDNDLLRHSYTYSGSGDNEQVTNTSTYQTFPWGEELVSETAYDPENPLAGIKPTQYAYYDNKENDGHNYGRRKMRIPGNPMWERYEYDAQGRVIKTVSCFGSADPDAPEDQSRVTLNDYTPLTGSGDDGTLSPNTPRTVVETVLGAETSRHYTVIIRGESRSIRAASPGAVWNDPANLVTITCIYTDGDFKGKTRSVTRPDGTMSLYSYAISGDTMTTTVDSGVPNAEGTAITDGTRSITVENKLGKTLSSQTTDIASGATLSSSVNSDFDDFGRATLTTYLDGTQTQTAYGCCGPETVTDREGNTTVYGYDEFRRLSYETRNNISTFYTYDDADNVVETIRKGTDNSEVTLSGSVYDTAGRLVSSTDAAGHTTAYAYGFDAAGNLTTTTTLPDGATRVETRTKDHQTLGISGTAARPVAYEYGVDANGTYTVTYKGSDSTATEWVKSYTDLLGRNYLTVYPDGSERRSTYNTLGQLVKTVAPDGITTLYAYNDKGEQEYTCLDLDRDGVIDFAGTDRITRTVTEIGPASITGATGTVRRSKRYVWDSPNADSATLVGVSESSLDGRTSWSESYGRVSSNATAVDAAAVTKTVTATAPDSTYTVTQYQNGQLLSTTRYAADSTQISQTSYGYDAHGRQVTLTDARTGTTTTTYDAADRVVSTTTPDPDDGGPQSAQTTSYTYTVRNQRETVTHPDGGVVNYTYWPTGELRKTWGARTYPVEYTYDAQGRRQTLTTWQDFSGDSGQAVTTWNYHPQRGWLTSKLYNDGKGTAYTYTPAGKLLTRTWARGLTTTYAYDNAGQLTSVDYSDTIPDLAYTYDRLGRKTSATDAAGTHAYTYNADGTPDTETVDLFGDSFTLDRSYDSLGRPTGYALANLDLGNSLLDIGYSYDSAGRLHTVSDGASLFSYGYLDGAPAQVETITANNGSSDVMTTTKTYDNLNRLTQIAQSANSTVVSSHTYTYNSANQRTRATLETGEYWDYSYDSLGQVTGGIKKTATGTAIPGYTFGYNFDDIGNRQTSFVEDAAPASLSSYSANLLNQYTQRTVPGLVDVRGEAEPEATVSLTIGQPAPDTVFRATRSGRTFHARGTVDNTVGPVDTTLTITGVRPESGTDGKDIVTEESRSVRIPQTPEQFTYDDDGNLLSDGTWTYTWNGENRLVKLESENQKLEFAYDCQGRRVGKKSYSGSTVLGWTLTSDRRFLYDGWNLIAELATDNGQLTTDKTYTWGLDLSGSMQGAGGVGGLLAISTTDNGLLITSYPAYDGNGNVMALVNATAGAASARYEYDPFGNTLVAVGETAASNVFRFSTKYTDPETGFCYYGYRYYNPELGRWLNRDPIKEVGGINTYAFCCNDSLSFTDLCGLARIKIKTIDDTVFVLHDPKANEFVAFLERTKSEGRMIKYMGFLGHGASSLMTISNDDYLEVRSGVIKLSTLDDDLTPLFRSIMASESYIDLIGCNTARGDNNIARDISVLLPRIYVQGSKKYTLSTYEIYHFRIGIPFRVRCWKTYKNGIKQ